MKQLFIILMCACFASPGFAVDFSRDIKPILSDRCFACHGPDHQNRKAKLRLDLPEGAKEVLESGELLARIASTDPEERMPPPEAKLPALKPAEVEQIRAWIAEGAEYRPHWAFVPVQGDASKSIDDHIRDALDGLKPAPRAAKERLIRRITYDLTGLPPSIAEVDAFLTDESKNAWESVVDRLLSSPRFGERMASDWLDVARYADSYGYQADAHRDLSPWRDWVIRAFNDNLPYDQFVTWQLAGDLLPNPTRDQRLATAFNRHHRQTNEGGSINEEYRVEYVADRVHTFGTAFLGMTLECARCHDHKYDPISTKNYYQFSAFFSSVDESGLYAHFTSAVPTPALGLSSEAQDKEQADLRAKIEQAEKNLAAFVEERLPELDEQLQELPESLPVQGLVAEYRFDAPQGNKVTNHIDPKKPGQLKDNPLFVDERGGKALQLSGDNAVSFKGVGNFRRWDPFSFSLWMQTPDRKERAVIFHRSKAWTDSGSRGYQLLLEDGRLSWSLIHFWPGNAIRVRSVEPVPEGEWLQATVTYDGSSRASGLKIYLNGAPVETEVVRDHLDRTIHGNWGLAIGERFRDRGFKDGLVDDFKVFDRCLTEFEAALLHDPATERGLAERGLAERDLDRLRPYCLAVSDGEYAQQLADLRSLRMTLGGKVDGVREIMTMVEMAEPRSNFVLKRGSYEMRGEAVQPDTPAAILPFAEDLPRNRLGLAQWLCDPKHPLTARVAVNRLWQMMFGEGLVRTSEDFGSQGSLPSHPGLLDSLSRRFVASGWDTKALIKEMALSETYRQDSRVRPGDLEADPENIRLARGPAYRLSAEMIRDGALAASGLLVDKRYGPPVYPYQPAGLWKEKSGKTYKASSGEGLYRRSLYTFWKRTSPPPSMMTLDASKRDVCVVKRQRTSSPMQALLLMNDPQYVEAARALAERLLKEGGAGMDEHITLLYRLLTARVPSEQERSILHALYEKQLAHFQQAPQEAEALLKVGAHKRDASIPAPQLAAMTLMTSTLMNFDETVYKR